MKRALLVTALLVAAGCGGADDGLMAGEAAVGCQTYQFVGDSCRPVADQPQRGSGYYDPRCASDSEHPALCGGGVWDCSIPTRQQTCCDIEYVCD